jgi:hypothetical protein
MGIGVLAERRWIPVETVISEVRNSLCSGTEVGRRVDSAHRELEQKHYHWFGRKDHAELGYVGRIDVDAVENVGDIDFCHFVGSKQGL